MAIHTQRHTYDPSALLDALGPRHRALQAHRLPAPEPRVARECGARRRRRARCAGRSYRRRKAPTISRNSCIDFRTRCAA